VVPTDYPGFERYAGWLTIPYLAADGHPVSIRFRRPDWTGTEDKKYLGLPHERSRIYGIGSVLGASEDIHVSEGEFDSIVLRKVFGSGVGYPGASNWRPYHRVFYEGFRNVYIHGDGDPAGREFIEKMLGRIRNAVPVYYPDKKDVTDVYVHEGEEALKELIP
jgi:DNA primase